MRVWCLIPKLLHRNGAFPWRLGSRRQLIWWGRLAKALNGSLGKKARRDSEGSVWDLGPFFRVEVEVIEGDKGVVGPIELLWGMNLGHGCQNDGRFRGRMPGETRAGVEGKVR